MKIIYLHGYGGSPGGSKVQRLRQLPGVTVIAPRCVRYFSQVVAYVATSGRSALAPIQKEFDHHQPDLIVAASFGARLALELNRGKTPAILICPACANLARIAIALIRSFARTRNGRRYLAFRPAKPVCQRFLPMVKACDTIIHCPDDEVISLDVAEDLAKQAKKLIYVRLSEMERNNHPVAHRMNFGEAMQALENVVRDRLACLNSPRHQNS